MITHVSLDMWQTFLISNPDYEIARAQKLAEIYDIPANVAKGHIKEAKLVINWILSHGRHVSHFDAIDILTQKIGKQPRVEVAYEPSAPQVSEKLASTFLEFPPSILSESIAAIEKLKARGITISIGSNTHFSTGEWIGIVLRNIYHLNYDFFDFSLFSDREEFSKPQFEFFKEIVSCSNQLPQNIMHIGDHDFDRAAEKFGIQFKHVDNPESLGYILDQIK